MPMFEKLKEIQVLKSLTIKEAVVIMDDAGYGFCVCVDSSKKVIGIMTDGDFRRSVLKGIDLNNSVESIVNKDFIKIEEGAEREDVKNIFLTTFARAVPVMNSDRSLQDIVFKEDFFNEDEVSQAKEKVHYPVVIMAGGEGTRLAPFTNILPKPLLPLGNDPVIKVIMDGFNAGGVDEFYITVNSKKQMIRGYFHDHKSPYQIHFVDENEPLGTAGSLGLVKENINTNFFVVNCDVVLDIDYSDLVKFHNTGGFNLTLVASLKRFTVPYGVCNVDNQGLLVSMQEKPEQDLLANTGLYFLNSSVLDLISGNEFLHMTDVIHMLKEKGLKVGVYPVTEKSWLDVGQWEEYSETLKQLGL
jgi:dTDP-glucose pyrophosphorylase